jgi:hypothetical protein
MLLAKKKRVGPLFLVWSLVLAGVATSAETDLFQPGNWKVSKSKSGVKYLRCVSAKRGLTTVISYSYIPPDVEPLSFVAAGVELKRAFLEKGIATKVELGDAAFSKLGELTLYSQTSILSKESGNTETFVRGWLVGKKAALDIIVTSDEDADAVKASNEFVQLWGAMLALWEAAPKGACLKNALMTSCFGLD